MILTSAEYKLVGTNVLAVETKRELLHPDAGEASIKVLSVRKRFLTKKESIQFRHSHTGLVSPQERRIC